MRTLLRSLGLLLAVASTARAETVLSTGVMIGSTTGARIDCVLVNLGKKPITAVSQVIDLSVKGNVVPPTGVASFDFCTDPVAPNGACSFTYTDGAASGLGGVFRIEKGSAKTVRAFCTLRIGGAYEVRQLMQ
jgi:hypothetical protein